MDNLRIDDIEDVSDSDHIYAEKDTCLLEDSDAQCGYVFYNKYTRLLKFHCTYCRETYDNVQYFCQHLSDHINESNEEELYTEIESLQFKSDLEEKDIDQMTDIENLSIGFLKDGELKSHLYLSPHTNDTRDASEYEHQLDEEESASNENIDSEEILYNLNNEEMLIEEIEDADEMRADVEQDMLNQIQEQKGDCIFLSENSSPSELLKINGKHDTILENDVKMADNSKNGNSFEECFIKETNIDKIRTEGVCVLKEKNHPSRKPMQRKRVRLFTICVKT